MVGSDVRKGETDGQLAGEAHVWLLRPETVRAPDAIAAAEAMLSPDEVRAHRRLRFEDDRHLYLVSHAMLRRVLSRYDNVAPAAWRFSRNRYGRPEIATPRPALPLRFNLSHTPGLVACIVTHTLDCGVDAELIRPRRYMTGVATRMFAGAELQALQSLEGDARLERFFTYWTLREAYGKACGRGLAGAAGRHYRFEGSGDAGWQIRFGTATAEGDGWRFAVRRINDTHMLSVALHSTHGPAPAIRYRDFDFQSASEL
ncbi:MAG: 4'-phosphopantetheinyl transferase superfamily protein [Thiohalobacterales bacterium]|nr:4'-phosphopantetheinyl transferase superfamily protein [Thiohalobacterales bacterium]